MHVESGNPTEAVTLLERARAMVTRTLPANRDDLSILLTGLGRAYAAVDRSADAVAVLSPLVEPLRNMKPPKSMRFGMVCSTLAAALWSSGGTSDRKRARALAGDATAAFAAAATELAGEPLRADQLRLVKRRQAALAQWIAQH
jgi:hypothetical protein